MQRADVCVVGEINPDLILYGLPAELKAEHEVLVDGFRVTLGSSSAIFAHNLAALGTRVGIVSKVGTDIFGKMSLEWLVEAGVDVSRVLSLASTPTGVTVILAHPDHRYILTYPGSMFELSYGDLDRDYIFSARHLHLSSFFLHRALRPRIADLFREAKAKDLTTSLDTNDDPMDRWGDDLLEVLRFVDVFLPNEREAKKITRTSNLAQAARKLVQAGSLVVVKRGPAGAFACDGSKEWRCVPPTVPSKDAVGAGDSFDAGFIHRFVEGASVQDCLEWANVAGAYSTTGAGGIEAFRDRERMRQFFDEHVQRS